MTSVPPDVRSFTVRLLQQTLLGYQDVIRDMRKRGTYAEYIPVKSGPSGKLLEIVLVFRK